MLGSSAVVCSHVCCLGIKLDCLFGTMGEVDEENELLIR